MSLALSLAALPAAGDEFWAHWGDGQAELNGYHLTQPRYGEKRSGTAILVFVTEDMSDSLRVKADPGKHPASDVYPVLKLNAIRDFQTGIYDYNVMTSTFARVSPGWPVARVSFSSQEWCGHVYHQLLPRAGRIAGTFHSYFDGEADGGRGAETAGARDGVGPRPRGPAWPEIDGVGEAVYSARLAARVVAGAWRSPVAHLLWEQGVGGSNPLAPTFSQARVWAGR